ncbi:MAG: hypothetical protein A3C27_00050 [Candidatus Levybacteria bacterium RIFCSPHIGHO2_02_FULL_39_36]|nr:MAG: Phosphoribosylaminoimidazole (AIR) synthetase [Candidatus Levybacteria bacterium GW2011_GWA1_39_11]KKR24213.1 MAG: Phosphoribosylaminoimidazole (AIR) synthetase [Candidatus Levybacteria bacterium GW2011_GWB1_39_7]OGH14665.1 MAG: hypothetical protein A2689_02795 [Candidatus Levybacteria bacterium RIFCSPHIGHO2_01_FULL_38_96]OGH25687.1 MAG: hypothetical protein A3E68_01805 [Candidatus Levybacteria bacterium RIFCSPHIGHO2_12_FULL_39_39]OGH27685.1 MAG: hypothetical protein A3C27_00050 [Candid
MIQKAANLSDHEIYAILNMGQDYAIFVAEKDAQKTLQIIRKNKFKALDAGVVEKGKRQVVVKPKNIVFRAETLNLR